MLSHQKCGSVLLVPPCSAIHKVLPQSQLLQPDLRSIGICMSPPQAAVCIKLAFQPQYSSWAMEYEFNAQKDRQRNREIQGTA